MKRVVLAGLTLLMLMSVVVGAQAHGDKLKVVASFSILADVVANVGLNQVEVTSLVPLGADPHSYEPSARDLRALADADVIFVAGANFEEALLEAIENAGGDVPIVEASACVPMRAFGASHDHADEHEGEHADEDGHADEHEGEHADDHDHAHEGELMLDFDALCEAYDAYIAQVDAVKNGMLSASPRVAGGETLGRLHDISCGAHDHHADEGDTGHQHEAGACDPHVWSDPYNVYYWVLTVRDVLGQLDPDHAEQYAANAEEYIYALADLMTDTLHPLIESIPAERRVLVTNHETLGYFAAAYGFETVGFVLPGGSAFAEPSAQAVVGLVELIRAEGVAAVFAETTISAAVARQVAAEAGVSFYALYTDSLSAADGPAATYLDYLTVNVQTIAQALE